tara:strand:+ start:666 stop:863 length:198 start_codon:yes stop_codon:yes gene_type:complete
MTEWISLKDRFPETDDDVLYCLGIDIKVVGYQITKGFFIIDDEMDLIDVTDSNAFWMPLPKPPTY